MEKKLFPVASLFVLLFTLVFFFTQCNSSADNKTASVDETEAIDTITPAPVTKEPTPGIEEPATIAGQAAPQTEKITQPAAVTTKKEPQKGGAVKPPSAPVESRPTPVEAPVKTEPVPVVTPPPAPAKVDKPAPPAETAPIQQTTNFTFKANKALIEGTSTLHAWESKITKAEGKGKFQLTGNVITALKDVEIKMAVTGIKSKEGKKMDDKTYETFNSDKNPNIIYSFSSAQVKIDDAKNVTIETSGNLSMGGTTKAVSLSARGKEMANGDLQLSVSKKIKMTDFKMEPPVMMLGTIKVGDEVTVVFDFVLEKSN